MLFGKNHPARTGRRRVRAPRQAPERLSVLMQHRSVATKLWHTGCVGGSQSRAADAAVVWGARPQIGAGGTWDHRARYHTANISTANLFSVLRCLHNGCNAVAVDALSIEVKNAIRRWHLWALRAELRKPPRGGIQPRGLFPSLLCRRGVLRRAGRALAEGAWRTGDGLHGAGHAPGGEVYE